MKHFLKLAVISIAFLFSANALCANSHYTISLSIVGGKVHFSGNIVGDSTVLMVGDTLTFQISDTLMKSFTIRHNDSFPGELLPFASLPPGSNSSPFTAAAIRTTTWHYVVTAQSTTGNDILSDDPKIIVKPGTGLPMLILKILGILVVVLAGIFVVRSVTRKKTVS